MSHNLADYFQGVALKTLSVVEIDRSRSNQHEFQATASMREFLGNPREPVIFPATFLYLADNEDLNKSETSTLTLYDARKNNPNRSPEYRLYFRDNDATDVAHAGDLMAILQKPNKDLVVVIAQGGSLVDNQVRQLFGQTDATDPNRFAVSTTRELSQESVALPEKIILELLGAETAIPDESLVSQDIILETFPQIPTGRELAEFARMHSPLSLDDVGPDQALMNWLNIEYESFRSLERRDVHDRLHQGFFQENDVDVESFIQFSTSVLNRRKSRAGKSLEYHLEHIFRAHNVLYSSQEHTEGRNQPDFLFPGIAQYQQETFPGHLLTFLGAKRTLKERWRQVLSEAQRIPIKHLATIDVGLTSSQISEITQAQVRLVIPEPVIALYPEDMATEFLSLTLFLQLVTDRQSSWQ